MKNGASTPRRSSRSRLATSPTGRGGLRQLLRGTPRNRRLKPKSAPKSTPKAMPKSAPPTQRAARPKPNRAPGRPLLQRIGSLAKLTAQTLVVLSVLGGMGWTGYQGYRLAMSSSYFTVRTIRIAGFERAPHARLLARVAWTKGRSIFALRASEVAETIAAHPWVARATAERRLPDTLEINVEEHDAQAVVLLGHLYLINAEGVVFKRASPDEAEGLPVISGIERLAYLNGRGTALKKVARALEALRRYTEAKRPALGEIHVGNDDELTLFLRRGGTALRFGQRMSAERLRKLDAVWAALGPDTRRARAVYLDHEQRTERVVVRLASYQ